MRQKLYVREKKEENTKIYKQWRHMEGKQCKGRGKGMGRKEIRGGNNTLESHK